jgi:hypothetical protein
LRLGLRRAAEEEAVGHKSVDVGVEIKILMLALVAADPGESALQVAAFQKLVDDLKTANTTNRAGHYKRRF